MPDQQNGKKYALDRMALQREVGKKKWFTIVNFFKNFAPAAQKMPFRTIFV
jgi:hypothetical protein